MKKNIRIFHIYFYKSDLYIMYYSVSIQIKILNLLNLKIKKIKWKLDIV